MCMLKVQQDFPMFTVLVSYLRAQKIQAPMITYYYKDRPQCLYVQLYIGTGMKSASLVHALHACM